MHRISGLFRTQGHLLINHKDYELSEFAKELMDWLFDDAELYYGFIIDMMAEQVGLVQSEGITVLSYYILRRKER